MELKVASTTTTTIVRSPTTTTVKKARDSTCRGVSVFWLPVILLLFVLIAAKSAWVQFFHAPALDASNLNPRNDVGE